MSKRKPPPGHKAKEARDAAPAVHIRAPHTHKLWQILHEWLARAMARFGEPSAIMALVFMSPMLRRAADLALRPIERLMRMLLLIEAAYAEPLCEVKFRRLTEERTLKDKGHVQDPDDPSTWRAAFKLATRMDAPACASCDIGIKPRQLASAPIAERLEALLRVLDDPMRFIRRLQQKLPHIGPRLQRKLRFPPRIAEPTPIAAARILAARDLGLMFNSS